MKGIVKKFCFRGLIFSGFGPLIYGIVMLIVYLANVDTMCSGLVIFKGIISTYFLGFICAGVSVVWSIDRLSIGVASLIQCSCLYVCYLIVYLVNNWIPRNPLFVLYFSIIFIATYVIIWLITYFIEKARAKKLTNHLK